MSGALEPLFYYLKSEGDGRSATPTKTNAKDE